MKAYVLHGIGDYRYEEAEVPLVDPGTVLVRVRAAGIYQRNLCFFIPIISNSM